MRCCVVCRTDPLGRTGAQRAAASAVGAGTFSNSNVTTLTRRAKLRDRIQIVVRRHHFHVRHLAGRRVLIRRQRVDAIAHAPRRDGEHAPQLPASQHANGGAGQYRLDHASSSERTCAACSSRKTRSFSRSAGS